MKREISFQKFHGLGNDFIVSSGRGLPADVARLARAITNRRTGVGADGFIVVLTPRVKSCRARLRFFNADGSEAEMSGNGIRCAAAYLHLLARTTKPRPLRIETKSGTKTLDPLKVGNDRWVFRVGMGKPTLEPRRIPFRAAGARPPVVAFPLRTIRGVLPVTVTSMGNPHCTVPVANFAAIDWAALGREIENAPLFPRRTNVEFVKVISRKQIECRFWERGVGATNSSGTGSCAAVVACILNGWTERRVQVRTVAGTLLVAWPSAGEVTLTGPVARIAGGKFIFAV